MEQQMIQTDMFITDLRELQEYQKEERERKNNKKLRAAFHLLSDLGKSMKEKTPQDFSQGANQKNAEAKHGSIPI